MRNQYSSIWAVPLAFAGGLSLFGCNGDTEIKFNVGQCIGADGIFIAAAAQMHCCDMSVEELEAATDCPQPRLPPEDPTPPGEGPTGPAMVQLAMIWGGQTNPTGPTETEEPESPNGGSALANNSSALTALSGDPLAGNSGAGAKAPKPGGFMRGGGGAGGSGSGMIPGRPLEAMATGEEEKKEEEQLMEEGAGYAAGGGADEGGGSKSPFAGLFGNRSVASLTGADGESKFGPDGKPLNPMGTADPNDYFGRLDPNDSLFIVVTRRYQKTTGAWTLNRASEVLKKVR